MKNVGIERYIIRVVACSSAFLALMGTGFGAWVFTQDNTTPSILHSSVEMEAAMDFSGFNVALNGELAIDENGSTFSDCSITVKTTVGVIQGFYAQDDADGNYSVDADRKIKSISLNYDVTCTFNDTNLNSYIYCKKVSNIRNHNPENASYTFSDVSWSEIDDSSDETGLSSSTEIEAVFPIVFDWQDNMHPKTTADYNTMMSALSSIASNAITFKVNFDASDEDSQVFYYAD